MINASIYYRASDNVWVVTLRVDTSDEYECQVNAELCRTAGQALDEAMSMF